MKPIRWRGAGRVVIHVGWRHFRCPSTGYGNWEPSHRPGRVMALGTAVVPPGYTAYGQRYSGAFDAPEEVEIPAGWTVVHEYVGDPYTTSAWVAYPPGQVPADIKVGNLLNVYLPPGSSLAEQEAPCVH